MKKLFIITVLIYIMNPLKAEAYTCQVNTWQYDKQKEVYFQTNVEVNYRMFSSKADAYQYAVDKGISLANITKEQGQEKYSVWNVLPDKTFVCNNLEN